MAAFSGMTKPVPRHQGVGGAGRGDQDVCFGQLEGHLVEMHGSTRELLGDFAGTLVRPVRHDQPADPVTSERLYHHPTVLAMSAPAVDVIGDLFRHYRKNSRALPPHVELRFEFDGEARAIADYVAGMTDRFAFAEHARLRAS